MAVLYLLIIVLCFPNHGWSYVDPGSISLLLQVIVAFVLGALITFRNRMINVLKFISKLILVKKKFNYQKDASANKK